MTAPPRAHRQSVETKIRGWVTSEGYRLVDANAAGDPPPTWVFGLLFTPTPRSTVQMALPVVIVGKDSVKRVEMIVDAQLSIEHARLLNEKSGYAQRALKRIREPLLIKGVGFNFVRNEAGRFVNLRFDEVMYWDGISQDSFMRKLRGLYSIFLFACDVLTELTNPGSGGFEPEP